jgi:amino acid adenylation domain-containing protein
VLHGDTAVTYGELDRIADAWAARLAATGVGPGASVPIVLGKGVDLIATLLAALKTGAAYALLDRGWPAEQTRAVIEQLVSPIVVTEPGGLDGIDTPTWTPPGAHVDAPPGYRPLTVDGSHPCCVFFTSGTTGRPKGVLTAHRATARLFTPGGFAHFDAATVVPLAAPVPWDAFSLELWSALLNGGTSVVVDEPFLSAGSLRAGIASAGVNNVWLTGSLFNMIVDEDVDTFQGITQVMVGGERLSPSHVRVFLRRHPSVALLNGYGPVESTVFATTHRIMESDCDRIDGIPLGRPVPGTCVFVLDGDRQCEIDEPGEICIAGDGLAVGYLGDTELTEAKFRHVDIGGSPLRVYRTGDFGHCDQYGLLHFAGRADRQVKVRGHRIEPAEVERQIERLLSTVRSCRVVIRRDNVGTPDGLLAFCIPTQAGDQLAYALPVLKARMVAYHHPVAVVSVAAFPVTPNGKVDEYALLDMLPATGATQEVAFADDPPSADPVERTVREVIADVLGRPDVPVDVSFFDLGGTSLEAGRVCTRLAARLGQAVAVSWLYQCPTAAGFAGRLRTVADAVPAVAVSADAREVPLTPMQTIFLIRHLADPSDRTSHCILTWLVEGDLDRAAMEAAIAAVHHRHEALRAAYVPDPAPLARVVDVAAPRLEILSSQPTVDAAVAALRLELADGLEPMDARIWRAALVSVDGTATSVLGCVVHHIAFDGRSESILARDLSSGYNGALSQKRSTDAPLSLATGYSGHAERMTHADLESHRVYLAAEVASVPELRWPAWKGQAGTAPIGCMEAPIDPQLLRVLDATAAAHGVSRFAALLSQWGAVLSHVTGQDDFAIGIPVAQRSGTDADSMIGCHITMVCIRMRGAALCGGPLGMTETARIVQRAFAAQDLPLTHVFSTVGRTGSGRPPAFQTLFALQDSAPPTLYLSGLNSTFARQPYLDLPLELHAEFWPDYIGGLRLAASYRTSAVHVNAVRECVDRFLGLLHSVTSWGQP